MTDLPSPKGPRVTLQLSNLPDRLLSASEVAGILNVSVVQIYRLARMGELGSVPFRSSVRFLPGHVTQFISVHVRDAG
jgi:excisionase family DNA binding protein